MLPEVMSVLYQNDYVPFYSLAITILMHKWLDGLKHSNERINMAAEENLIEQNRQPGFWTTFKSKYKKLPVFYKLLALFCMTLGYSLVTISGIAGLADLLNLIIFIVGTTLTVVTFVGRGMECIFGACEQLGI